MKNLAKALLVIASAVGAKRATAAPHEPELPTLRCSQHVCLVAHTVKDSDGDGVSDDDELAAGTDPKDPNSVPPVAQLLEMAQWDVLPSFSDHHSMILVLPTVAPNGKPILGGLPALPGRQNVLETMGVSWKMLGEIDLSNGLTVARDKGPAKDGKPPMKVGGINIAHISAGGNKGPTAFVIPPKETPRVTVYEEGWFGGKEVVSDTRRTETPWGFEVRQTATEDGKDFQRWRSSETEEHDDGTKTTTETFGYEDKDQKVIYSEQTNTDGTKTVTTRVEDKRNDTSVVIRTTSDQNSTTNTVTKCEGESCTSTTNTEMKKDANTCDAACEAAEDGQQNVYVNPDDTSNDPIDQMLIDAAISVLHANVKSGKPPIEVNGPPATSTPEGPLVMYVDEDPSSNSFGIGAGSGSPKVILQPRTDPHLPNPVRDGILNQGGGCSRPGTC